MQVTAGLWAMLIWLQIGMSPHILSIVLQFLAFFSQLAQWKNSSRPSFPRNEHSVHCCWSFPKLARRGSFGCLYRYMLSRKFLLSLCTASATIWAHTGFYSKTCPSFGLCFCYNINIDWAVLLGLWSRCSAHRRNSMCSSKYCIFVELLGLGERIALSGFA